MSLRAALPHAALVLAISAGLWVVVLAARPAPAGAGPILVVAPPWNGGPPAVIRAAGGWTVGPAQAPLSALSAGAEPAALRRSGAWLLLDATALDIFCLGEDPT
jgi:hypothetical protein